MASFPPDPEPKTDQNQNSDSPKRESENPIKIFSDPPKPSDTGGTEYRTADKNPNKE